MQALAIAHSIRRKKKMAEGGLVDDDFNINPDDTGDEIEADTSSNDPDFLKNKKSMSRGGMIAGLIRAKKYAGSGIVSNQEDLSDDEDEELGLERMPADPEHEVDGSTDEMDMAKRRKNLLTKIFSSMK